MFNSTSKKLFDKHSGKLMGICLRYTKSTGQAEAMLSDGFTRILKLQEPDEALIKRTIIENIVRKLTIDFDAIITDNPQYTADTTATGLIKLLQRLPTINQVIFNLHTIDGYTQYDAAQLLNISEELYSIKLSETQSWINKSLTKEDETVC